LQDLPVKAGWTVFPPLPLLHKYFPPDVVKWFVFVDELSVVRPNTLSRVLSKFKTDYGIFIGHALNHKSDTFPDDKAGFAMSSALVRDIADLGTELYRHLHNSFAKHFLGPF
jgi:hypothetical protein